MLRMPGNVQSVHSSYLTYCVQVLDSWLPCMQDQTALMPTTKGMKSLKVLRFDGCGVSTLAAYQLLKTCPDRQLQCWRDGEHTSSWLMHDLRPLSAFASKHSVRLALEYVWLYVKTVLTKPASIYASKQWV